MDLLQMVATWQEKNGCWHFQQFNPASQGHSNHFSRQTTTFLFWAVFCTHFVASRVFLPGQNTQNSFTIYFCHILLVVVLVWYLWGRILTCCQGVWRQGKRRMQERVRIIELAFDISLFAWLFYFMSTCIMKNSNRLWWFFNSSLILRSRSFTPYHLPDDGYRMLWTLSLTDYIPPWSSQANCST